MFKKKRPLGDSGGVVGGGGSGAARGNVEIELKGAAVGASKKAAQRMTTQAMTTQTAGDKAEELALAFLLSKGLRLVQRNYRVARGPALRGAEIDLIMQDRNGTLVFVEVRSRSSRSHGGAAASVGHRKRQSLLLGAQHYLMQLQVLPACRFDVVEVEDERCNWLPAAFDASR